MPRGGARPGSGRPKGSKNRRGIPPLSDPVDICLGPDIDPLTFLLSCMRNPAVDLELRIRCASLCLPYVPKRAVEIGKKEEAQAAAQRVARSGRFQVPAAPRTDGPADDNWDSLPSDHPRKRN